MAKVFLGGTCANSTWRDKLIPTLTMDYFNPVVKDWTPECQEEERVQRQNCEYILYVLTSEMKGVYSVAEVVDDSNKRPGRTVLCMLQEGFDADQWKSLVAVGAMVRENGSVVLSSLEAVAAYLRSESEKV